MTDHKAFVIIIKVTERKFDIENMLHSIRVCYQRFEIVLAEGILSFITTLWLEKMHTLVSILQERIMNSRDFRILMVNGVHFTTVPKHDS